MLLGLARGDRIETAAARRVGPCVLAQAGLAGHRQVSTHCARVPVTRHRCADARSILVPSFFILVRRGGGGGGSSMASLRKFVTDARRAGWPQGSGRLSAGVTHLRLPQRQRAQREPLWRYRTS